ncbi:MAG: glycosyltransferase [Cyanobacteriota bacterium]|nr:glycosyltransferase [Cyanobacteriota bacterium]
MSNNNEKVFLGPTVSMLLMGDYDINLGKPVTQKQKYAGISVVVPTFKRVDLCQRLLASLGQSKLYLQAPVEIIFVDNSPLPQAQQIHALCMEYGAKYYLKKTSVSAKRNFGAKIASHSIVLFVDSDCEASPQLLAEHLESYQKDSSVVAVLGKTNFKGPTTWMWRVLQFTCFLMAFRLADKEGQRVWGPSNNLSCRKETFLQVGGFDETFPKKPGGEDIDFGYRLYKQGYLLTTNPEALVYHTTETWNTISQVVSRLFNWGKAELYLFEHHREFIRYECPKCWGLFLAMLPVALVAAVACLSPQWLLLPMVFLAVNFLSRILLHISYNPERLGRFFDVLIAEVLILVFEFGLAYECWREKWFIPLFNRLIVVPEDALVNWNSQVIYSWILMVQILISVSLVKVL